MARQPNNLDRRGVKDWFLGLSFDMQEAVLADFEAAFAVSKAERISALESELNKLRNGSAAPVRTATGRPGRPPRAQAKTRTSEKKGVKVPPKYADKEGNTWAGRGVYPVWIRDYLKKRGNKLEDLLIAKT